MGTFFTEKISQSVQVFFRCRRIAQPVSGSRYGQYGFPGGTGLKIYPAHLTRHIVVALPMYEYYGEGTFMRAKENVLADLSMDEFDWKAGVASLQKHLYAFIQDGDTAKESFIPNFQEDNNI